MVQKSNSLAIRSLFRIRDALIGCSFSSARDALIRMRSVNRSLLHLCPCEALGKQIKCNVVN